jgi:hypothetical protein
MLVIVEKVISTLSPGAGVYTGVLTGPWRVRKADGSAERLGVEGLGFCVWAFDGWWGGRGGLGDGVR